MWHVEVTYRVFIVRAVVNGVSKLCYMCYVRATLARPYKMEPGMRNSILVVLYVQQVRQIFLYFVMSSSVSKQILGSHER